MNISIFLFLGILLSLLFPPYFFFPIGFIIFPYLCFFIDKLSYKYFYKKKFVYFFCFYFNFFLILLFWIKDPFFVFEETKNYFLISILLVFLLSFIFTTITILTLSFNKNIPVVFLIPLIFIIGEYIISTLFYGFPWISFSLIISGNDFILNIIKYFGTFLTSYLVIQLFCLPYLFFYNKHRDRYFKHLLIIFSSPFIFGLLLNFAFYQTDETKKESLDIEIFQLNFKNDFSEKEELKKFKEIEKHISNSQSDLIIFAENNYPYLVENINLEKIQNILKQNQTVIIGGTRKDGNKFYNTLFNINNSKVFYYDKKMLVPFGEFLPLRNYLKFLDLISGPNDYYRGEIDRLINLNDKITYLPVICYEILFYWKLFTDFNSDTNFIVNITNDIWFGNYLGPYQHFYFSRLRASEFNKTLIRVSNNGISGIIDKNGKILSILELNKIGSIKYNLQLENNKNLYNIHYYLNFYFFIILILLFLLNIRPTNEYR